jgi:hypothetical protein
VWLFGGAPLLSWLVSVGVAPPNGGGVPRQASGSVAGSSLMGRGGSLTWLGWQSFQKNPLACFKKKKTPGTRLACVCGVRPSVRREYVAFIASFPPIFPARVLFHCKEKIENTSSTWFTGTVVSHQSKTNLYNTSTHLL